MARMATPNCWAWLAQPPRNIGVACIVTPLTRQVTFQIFLFFYFFIFFNFNFSLEFAIKSYQNFQNIIVFFLKKIYI
jgi:hypothetical protein